MRKLFLGLLSILLLALPFHPFLITWASSVFFGGGAPNVFLASWKEVLISIMAIIFLIQLLTRKIPLKLDFLDALIIMFVSWSLITGFLWTDGGEGGDNKTMQIILGIKYGLLFLAVFFMVRHTPFTDKEKDVVFSLALASGTIVIIFGLLQQYLPEDFLVGFGYSASHSFGSPDQALAYCQKISDTDTCRAQSTFSGPNQLGAYLSFIIPLLFFGGLRSKQFLLKLSHFFMMALGFVVLYYTYSRAAWLGISFALVIALLVTLKEKRWFAIFADITAFVSTTLIALSIMFVKPEIIQKIDGGIHEKLFYLLHSEMFYFGIFIFSAIITLIASYKKSPTTAFLLSIFNSGILLLFGLSRFMGEYFWQVLLRPSSTQGHFERSADGINYIIQNPWGLGLGDAGPASSYFAKDFLGFIPENWFLQVGLESGVLGLFLYLMIMIFLLGALFDKKEIYAKAIGVSLIALSIHSMFLHTWESSAVAISFFALAGVSLANNKKTSLLEKFFSLFK